MGTSFCSDATAHLVATRCRHFRAGLTFTVNGHRDIFKIGVLCHVSSQVSAGRRTLCGATHRSLSFVMAMADGRNKLRLGATATATL